MDLGRPAYPRPKGAGDHSMPVKRGVPRVRRDPAPRGPRGTAKATLLEPQSRPEHSWSRSDADSTRRHRVPPLGAEGAASPRDEVLTDSGQA